MNTLLSASMGVLEDLSFAIRTVSNDRSFSIGAAFT